MTCRHKWEPVSTRVLSGRIVRQVCVCARCKKVRVEETPGGGMTAQAEAQSDLSRETHRSSGV